MKGVVLILSFLLCLTVNAQKIVEEFGSISGFCSNRYYLFDDGTFAYERGCEQRSAISLGNYRKSKDTLYLFPKLRDELNLIESVEYLDMDPGLWMRTSFVSREDKVFSVRAIYPSIQDAEKWHNGDVETIGLKNDPIVDFDIEQFTETRLESNTLASCPLELERLLKDVFSSPEAADQ